jgi:hypothetical protein
MSRISALIQLGLSGQDFGPCYADAWSYKQFAAMWRGTVPCPSEAEIEAAAILADQADAKQLVQEQIDAIERATLMNRGSREMAMRQIEERAQADATETNTATMILAAQPFYVRLKEVDEQVSALRVQL